MSKKITVDLLTRVEGHGAVQILEENGQITAQVQIFEGPRFYEYLVVGQNFYNIPRIVSRICGICYVSHRTASSKAIEDAFGVEIPPEIDLLRKLANVGAYFESHGLHIYFLALPDYFGYPSLLDMAGDYPSLVDRGFKLKNGGVEIMKILTGKNFHGENLIPGGLAKLPTKEEIKKIKEILEEVKEDTEQTLRMMAKLEQPSLETEREIQMSIYNPKEWDFYTDNLILLKNGEEKIFTKKEYELYVDEKVVKYSMAKQSYIEGKPILVGPLARVNIYKEKLSDSTKKLMEECGIEFPQTNPFYQNIARAVELVEILKKGINYIDILLSDYPKHSRVELKPKAGKGFAVVEAPRGSLYHTYEFDNEGICVNSNIITPTAVLQADMEADAKALIKQNPDKSIEELRFLVERLIRSYDPCISCSVH